MEKEAIKKAATEAKEIEQLDLKDKQQVKGGFIVVADDLEGF